MKERIPEYGVVQEVFALAESDPMVFVSIVVALIAFVLFQPMAALSTFSGIAVMGGVLYLYNVATRKKEERPVTTGSNSVSATKDKATTRLKNIWETSKGGGDHSKKKTYEEKPFGSKYYYAHNNPNSTGGYKDGLRMEDYTMNGPRLLSKDGKKVDDPVYQDSGTSEEMADSQTVEAREEARKRITAHDPDTKQITKYLWDDPGAIKGIATIRIDTLPGKNGKSIDWKDVEVQEVKADLLGEGLLVKVETTDQGKYQLKIAKLYGEAADVKTLVKPKRLLIKIYKKKNAVLSRRDESNLEAWPQPYRNL